MITPPLFRLDGAQKNVLRVVRAGSNLAEDRESMFWMNIKSIPSVNKEGGQNVLQIAVKTRIKLIYRPNGLKDVPEERTEELKWQRSGNQLQVTHPTPFYMNFKSVIVGGKEVPDVIYVAPMSTAPFPATGGGSVVWRIITDFGAVGQPHTSTF